MRSLSGRFQAPLDKYTRRLPLTQATEGIVLASPAAILVAAFQHVYIWVHYFCTELPDMRRIYGRAATDTEHGA